MLLYSITQTSFNKSLYTFFQWVIDTWFYCVLLKLSTSVTELGCHDLNDDGNEFCRRTTDTNLSADREGSSQTQVCPLPKPWYGIVAQGAQAPLPLQGLRLPQMQPYCRETTSYGRAGRSQETAGSWGRHCSRLEGLHRRIDANSATGTALGTRNCLAPWRQEPGVQW